MEDNVGSGKTTMCCAEVAYHALTVPGGKTLITAPILKQIKDAVLPELNKFLPPWLLSKVVMTPSPYYKLKNGHDIVIYASNDEQNLRSLNLTAFYVEEASNVDESVFVQLQTRLRNLAAVEYDQYGHEIGSHYMGLVSTNPEECWVRDNFLLKSNKIYTSKSIDRSIYDLLKVKTPIINYESFLSSSRDNVFLPKNFIRDVCAGKSPSWIAKYIDCRLDVKEGAVYKEFFSHIVEPFPIPDEWLRVYGFDKGYNDPTALLCGAVDPNNYTIYIYDEYYVSEQPITYHAKQLPKYVNNYNKLYPIQADPSIKARNEKDGLSYQNYFLRLCNIWLEPANNDIDFGITKVRDYLYTGKLKIFANCTNLKDEASKYVYNTPDSKFPDKPIDKYNHLMDCLRYLVARLPDNPYDFNRSILSNAFVDKAFKNISTDDFTLQGGVIGGMKLWKNRT